MTQGPDDRTVSVGDPRWEAVDEQLFVGNTVAAIKFARERFAWTLPTAEDHVELRRAHLRATRPESFTDG